MVIVVLFTTILPDNALGAGLGSVIVTSTVVKLVKSMHPVCAIMGSGVIIISEFCNIIIMQTHGQKLDFVGCCVLPSQLGSLLPPETRNCKESCQFQWQKMSLKHYRLVLLSTLQW